MKTHTEGPVYKSLANHSIRANQVRLNSIQSGRTLMEHAPLAEKLRPREKQDFNGQDAIWSTNSHLRKLVESGAFRAGIFWGPPGSGKTTLARIIAEQFSSQCVFLSAVTAGVKDIRAVIEDSRGQIQLKQPPILLFLDEIHRLSKSQQDALLPALESGDIRFIGATTENPSFEVNRAVLSRCLVFTFQRYSAEALCKIARQASSRDAHAKVVERLSDDVLQAVAKAADGDARQFWNLIEAVAAATPHDQTITLEGLRPFAGSICRQFDKSADLHFDIVSAMIKCIRASQPDAALYYCARLIDAGEDPMYIARRLLISASEDIGNANPTALMLATSALQAVAATCYPECRIVFGQLVTYLAASPKSNRAYIAMDAAIADVKMHGSVPVPLMLRNAPTKLMKEMGYGEGYVYAHDDQKAAARLNYLPPEIGERRYYDPLAVGTEKQLRENLEKLRGSSRID